MSISLQFKPYHEALPKGFADSNGRVSVMVRIGDIHHDGEFVKWTPLNFASVKLYEKTVRQYVQKQVDDHYSNVADGFKTDSFYMVPDFDHVEEILYYNAVPMWEEPTQ